MNTRHALLALAWAAGLGLGTASGATPGQDATPAPAAAPATDLAPPSNTKPEGVTPAPPPTPPAAPPERPTSAVKVVLKPSTHQPVRVGKSFYVTASAVKMTKTGGATLHLEWNDQVVRVDSVKLAPGSPFDVIEAANPRRFTVVAIGKPNACAAGPCNFDAVRIKVTAVAPGTADITLSDDGFDTCWGDPDTFVCFPASPTYVPATVTVVAAPSAPRK